MRKVSLKAKVDKISDGIFVYCTQSKRIRTSDAQTLRKKTDAKITFFKRKVFGKIIGQEFEKASPVIVITGNIDAFIRSRAARFFKPKGAFIYANKTDVKLAATCQSLGVNNREKLKSVLLLMLCAMYLKKLFDFFAFLNRMVYVALRLKEEKEIRDVGPVAPAA